MTIVALTSSPHDKSSGLLNGARSILKFGGSRLQELWSEGARVCHQEWTFKICFSLKCVAKMVAWFG